MDPKRLTELMEEVRDGTVSVEGAVERLRSLPFEDLGFARLDYHRALRRGMPEVIFSQGKTPAQTATIFERMMAHHDRVLATRASAEHYAAVHERVPEAVYHDAARVILVDRTDHGERRPGVLIVTAGTSDIPVAEEAALTAELMGNAVERLWDVGVAGIHRLLASSHKVQEARVTVVAAGMEGALASVVGGLARGPVVAVPTSVGYGASFGGLSALLAMLNSCAPGVAVVNIDNGFGAGYLAGLINLMSWGEIR